MTSGIQHVLDNLAARLEREVAVDDLDFRLIAFTSHDREVDDVRRAAILTRRGPDAARAWALQHGIAKALRATRLPANAELGMLPRVCVALRQDGRHYGYLWLVDPDGSLTADDLVEAERAAEACAAVLHRERMGIELRDARGRELLRDLLSDDEAVRVAACAELDNEGLLDQGPLTVMAVAHESEEATTSLHDEVTRAMEGFPRQAWISLVRPDHGVVVSVETAATRRQDAADRLSARRMLVGVAESVRSRAQLHLGHRQAVRALRLSLVMPQLRPVARWSSLGVYRLLTQLAVDDLDSLELHPAVQALLEADPSLAETLELFLDRAGDTRIVAADLNVHRATVYYRLERIQALTGLDLADGEQRLMVHLSLKLLRVLRGVRQDSHSA